MYYANNVSKSAQKWLYSANNYKPALPRDEQIHAWLSAVAMGKSADFLTSLFNTKSIISSDDSAATFFI
ncbi:hypothetical protein AAUPMB_02806 [Pasteurella multocida subsp. multocida str. Anand1_buffalo]|nr:hypothetical protein AAUPMB_02806 [Pasteurella multocida subsp. multocida str. Anand1_buffalo]